MSETEKPSNVIPLFPNGPKPDGTDELTKITRIGKDYGGPHDPVREDTPHSGLLAEAVDRVRSSMFGISVEKIGMLRRLEKNANIPQSVIDAVVEEHSVKTMPLEVVIDIIKSASEETMQEDEKFYLALKSRLDEPKK